MAFNIVDTSYSGTYSEYFLMQATYGMDTVKKGLVAVIGDIKKQHTIARLDYKNPLKKRMATPTTNNANPFTMDGRLLIPGSVDIYEEFNPRDLESNQIAPQLSETVLAREVPQTLQSQMVQLVLNRAGEQYETGLWQGSTDYQTLTDETDPRYQLQFFDGFLKRMVNDPLVNLSTISPVTITTSNIFNIMDDLLKEATKKVKGLVTDPERYSRMKYIMSPLTEAIYTEALRTGVTFKGIALSTGYTAPWAQYAVEGVSGMADNTILFLRSTDEEGISNLYVGMNSMKDWELRLMRVSNASELFFIQGKFKWDVNYGWGQEVFMYTTLTPNSFKVL